MSFLLRLAARAMGAPGTPLLQPKDRGLARAYRAALARAAEEPPAEEPDPETAAPARRSALARVAATDATGWDEDEPEPATTDGTVARAAAGEPAEEDPPPDGPGEPLRPARAPSPEDPPSEDTPKPEELADDPPPSQARARRAALAPPPVAAAAGGEFVSYSAPLPAAEGRNATFEPGPGAPPDAAGPPAAAPFMPFLPMAPAEAPPAAGERTAPGSERPQVIVEQVDVLIHEPPQPPAVDATARRRARSFDARYLRRL